MSIDLRQKQEPLASLQRPWLPFLWIVAAAALAHLWCLKSQFYMDDIMQIRDNESIRNGVFWSNHSLAWTRLGYVLQFKMFGMSPVGFHAVNWLLHTANACVLFALGRDFLRGKMSEGVALFGAVLFATHPLVSEIPNYARTQDLAWVTLFSLLASWAMLRFLRGGSGLKLRWVVIAIVGATLSKGPGLFHALMAVGMVGIVSMTPEQRKLMRHRKWMIGPVALLGIVGLWIVGFKGNWNHAVSQWSEPRFIGHAYTLARVFWEFAWRAVIPVKLCSDHHIAESLVPPGAGWLSIPDKGAMCAAAAMLGLALFSLILTWRKPTRLFGVCLFLFVATILFRVAYLIPEFMPEYRIYPGMPWFCLGAAMFLGWAWKRLLENVSPIIPAAICIMVFAGMSAKRSLVWHDLDDLCAETLTQYPAQARALWELDDRDMDAGDWQKVIDRQRNVWPHVFAEFIEENKRLAPERELPSGHFALADVACKANYAMAIAQVDGAAAGLAEIHRVEVYMRQLGMDPVMHQIHWGYYHHAKACILEMSGDYQQALDEMSIKGTYGIHPSDIERVKKKLTPDS